MHHVCPAKKRRPGGIFRRGAALVFSKSVPDTLHSLRGGGKGPASAHWRRPVLKPLCFLVQLNDGVIQGDERQSDRIAEGLRPENHLLEFELGQTAEDEVKAIKTVGDAVNYVAGKLNG